jgi:hypothetical protein
MKAVKFSKMRNSGRNSRQMCASTSRILRNSAVAGLLAVLGGCSTVPTAFDNEALQAGVPSDVSKQMPVKELAAHEAADPLLVAKARMLAQGEPGEVMQTGAGSGNSQALVAKAKAMAQPGVAAIPENGAVGDTTDQMMIARAQALAFNNSPPGGAAQPQGLLAPAASMPQATYRQEAISRSEALGGRMPPEEVMSRLKAFSSAANPHEAAQADNSAPRSDRSDIRSASQGSEVQTARLEPDQTLQRLRELAARSKSPPSFSNSQAIEPQRSSTTQNAAEKLASTNAVKQANATRDASQTPETKARPVGEGTAQKPYSALGVGLRAASLQPEPQSSSILTR